MNAATFAAELQQNRLAYQRHRNEIRKAPAGSYAGIAQGRLVTIANSFDEATAAIGEMVPPPQHFLVFPADEEPAYELIDDFMQET